jgi:Skp family chaperone for outer membrane proteins
MKIAPVVAVLAGLGALAASGFAPQEKAAAGRTGALNLRDCMDKARNAWIADLEVELQKQQDADSGRATDLNPQDRARIRTKNLEASNRKRFEVYAEIVRLSGVIAKERGFEMVQRVDRMPVLEPPDTDLLGQIDRRGVIFFDPAVDITGEVLGRLNRDYAARKK